MSVIAEVKSPAQAELGRATLQLWIPGAQNVKRGVGE